MVFVPNPARDGVKTPVIEFTPGPEYVPPSGIPSLSFMGLALSVVIVSKQGVKLTIGARVPIMMIFEELAGLFVTHGRLDCMIHLTLSPVIGLYV